MKQTLNLGSYQSVAWNSVSECCSTRHTACTYRRYWYCTCEQRSGLDIVSGRTVRTK